jgi:hypothetical protein
MSRWRCSVKTRRVDCASAEPNRRAFVGRRGTTSE